MYLGVYEPLITAIANVQLDVVMLLVVGFGLTALVIVKLIEALFRRFRGVAYYAVIGFLVGSMVMVFPGFRSGALLAMDLVLFAVSAVISYMGMRLNSKLS
jgi:putative membrane protein